VSDRESRSVPPRNPTTEEEVRLSQLEFTGDVPNQVLDYEDKSKLRRVAGKMPIAVWLLSIASMCEQFAYYTFFGSLRTKALYIHVVSAKLTRAFPENYVQNAPKDSLRPGALELGQPRASLYVTLFLLISYLTPTLAAVVSANYLGKFRTITSSLVYVSRCNSHGQQAKLI
jgi:dipeptide/tripeptide permease